MPSPAESASFNKDVFGMKPLFINLSPPVGLRPVQYQFLFAVAAGGFAAFCWKSVKARFTTRRIA